MSKQFDKLTDEKSREETIQLYRQMLDDGIFDDYRTLSNRRAYIRIIRFVGIEGKLDTVNRLLSFVV